MERSEGLRWLENLGTAVVAPLILTWAFVAAASEPWHYLIVVAILVGAVVLFVVSYRQRGVCIIRADQVGYGDVDGHIRWIPRDQVVAVRISEVPFPVLSFVNPAGKVSDVASVRFFSPKEVVEAFESAGIPVKAPWLVRRQTRDHR